MKRKLFVISCFFLFNLSVSIFSWQAPEIRFLSPKDQGTWIGTQRIRFELRGIELKNLRSVEVYLDGIFLKDFKSPPYELSYDFEQVPKTRRLEVVVKGISKILARNEINSYPYDTVEEVHVLQVLVPVVVTDQNGSDVSWLKKDDFILFEDNKEQEINSFSGSGGMGFNLAMLIDISSSMADKIGLVKKAATVFLEKILSPKDKANLIFFNHDTFEDTGFTGNMDDLINSISLIYPFGKTALYDAIAYGLKSFRGIQGRNIIIIYSDGEDNSSFIDPYTLMKQTERGNAVIYSISSKTSQYGETKYWELLQGISKSSGGLTFTLRDMKNIDTLYARIKKDIKAQYILQFSPKGLQKLNRFRSISIKLKNRKNFKIRTINGYYY